MALPALFVYNINSGALIWNENGIFATAGSGGVLAVLDNRSPLLSHYLQHV